MSNDSRDEIGLDRPQGANEERAETYKSYDDGAPELATKRGAKSGSGVSVSDAEQAAVPNTSLEEAIQFSKKYLEDLLSFFGLNTDVYATRDDDVIQLNVPSTHMNGFLIGQRGENMRSLQYLTSTALKNNDYTNTRVNVDIAEYKKQRADRLREKAEEWVKEVRDNSQEKELQPMNAADRRVVHKLASEYGLDTESVGEGRDRHIVLKPTKD